MTNFRVAFHTTKRGFELSVVVVLQRYGRQDAPGARVILRYVIADRTSITRRAHRLKWRVYRRIGPSQDDVRKRRMPAAEEYFRQNMGNSFRDSLPTPPRSRYSDPETESSKLHHLSNFTSASQHRAITRLHAALVPLVTYLPVNPCVSVQATSTLPYFMVFSTIARLQATS